MIIFRYLARNLLTSTFAVSLVLLLVIVSSRFVKYLAEAASGKLDPGILLAIMGYRIPGFLELVLPLAFFLSILLAYGQLYVDSEMTVLSATGMSDKKLLGYTMVVALLIALVVGWLSLVMSPAGWIRAQELFNAQKQRGEIENLSAGKFYSLRGGKGVTYAESISKDGRMSQVFLAQSGSEGKDSKGMVVVVAEDGYSRQSENTGERYLVLKNGLRIQGLPGRNDYQLTRFEEYGQRLETVKPWELTEEVDAIRTRQLMDSNDPEHRAALQWRVSLPFMVMIVAVIAVPLSRTNPRQGRFIKILPAVMLYVLYLLSLNMVRSAIEEGAHQSWLGMVAVHGIFLGVGVLLAAWNLGWRPYRRPMPPAMAPLS